jgi:peptide/nickel transport system permease protein
MSGKLLAGLLLVVVVTSLVFLAVNLLPGDAATSVLGRGATPERIAALQEKMHLDEPLLVRYATWLGGAIHGDLGTALTSDQPVRDLLLPRLRNSLVLAFAAALIIIPLGVLIGAVAGARTGSHRDRALSAGSLVALSFPEFVLAAGLILIVGVGLGWLPPVSLFNPDAGPLSDPRVLVLPVLTLVIANVGYVARIVRASVAEAMSSEMVKMARLNGYSETSVVLKFGLRNALAPSIQMSALVLLYLISGVVVVETVFRYQGIGQLAIEATTNRDFMILQSLVLLSTAIFVVVNLFTDFLLVAVNPKLRTSR